MRIGPWVQLVAVIHINDRCQQLAGLYSSDDIFMQMLGRPGTNGVCSVDVIGGYIVWTSSIHPQGIFSTSLRCLSPHLELEYVQRNYFVPEEIFEGARILVDTCNEEQSGWFYAED